MDVRAPQIRSRFLLSQPAVAAGEAKPDSAKTYRFIASDSEFDRYDDRIGVKDGKPVAGLGWNLKNYNSNPVILYSHDDASGGPFGGASQSLPIGTGRAYLEKDAAGVERLMVDVQFDGDDDFARKVESKVAKGLLNAVSVRYLISPDGYEINERGGIDSWDQELLEISVVVIPGNQRALRAKALDVEAFRAACAKASGDACQVEKGVTLTVGRIESLCNSIHDDVKVIRDCVASGEKSAPAAEIKTFEFNPEEIASAIAAGFRGENNG